MAVSPLKGPVVNEDVFFFLGDDLMFARCLFPDLVIGGARCQVNVSRFSKFLSNSSVQRHLRRVSENDGFWWNLCNSSFKDMAFLGGI